jgi:hypothetical protein
VYDVAVGTFSRETLDPLWVTGFADAAGSFTYSRSSKQLALYFSVKLADADRALLEDLQTFFDAGRIYQPAYFRVTRREELVRVVDHFERYPLRSSKREVYELWREMVVAKQQFRRPDRERLAALAARLSELSGRR